jgi:hypothetical protein
VRISISGENNTIDIEKSAPSLYNMLEIFEYLLLMTKMFTGLTEPGGKYV